MNPPCSGHVSPVEPAGRSDGGVDFAAVFRHLPSACLLVDPQLRVVAANDACLDLLERPAEELLGRPAAEAVPLSAGGTRASTGDRLRLSLERARDTGRPDRLPMLEHGETDPRSGLRRRCLSQVSSAVPGPDGSTALVLHRIEDVTADIEAREELRKELARDDGRAGRGLSEALQRSQLDEPTTSTGLAVAVRYRPASDGEQVGGDWYDAFVTESGDTTVVVGDVTGHDRKAAAAMAQLRNVLRGVAQSLPDSPARVLSALDRSLGNLQVDTLATAVLVQVRPDPDPDHGNGVSYLVQWSNAGHPPPVLLQPDGTSVLLDSEPDLLLGLQPGSPRVDHHVRLLPGATLLLFTDGLLERRVGDLDAGLERLRKATEKHAGLSSEALCEALLAGLDDPLGDDVALLALSARPAASGRRQDVPQVLRVRPPGSSQSLVMPADPALVQRARVLVEDMCSTAGVDEDTCHTAVLLTSETVTNAIVHGRSDATLTVSASPGVVRVEVGDEDARRPRVGRRDPHALGGRGLEIVQLLAQRWGVRDERRGKVVWFELGEHPTDTSGPEVGSPLMSSRADPIHVASGDGPHMNGSRHPDD